jgi:hypothetical protein
MVRYATDQEGTGKFSVTAAVKRYSGVGAAWFDTLNLGDLSEDLATYPLPAFCVTRVGKLVLRRRVEPGRHFQVIECRRFGGMSTDCQPGA